MVFIAFKLVLAIILYETHASSVKQLVEHIECILKLDVHTEQTTGMAMRDIPQTGT